MMTFEMLRDEFARQLPVLEALTEPHFRRLGPEARGEAVQNTICLTWKGYQALCEKGRGEEEDIIRKVLWWAVKQTKVGRSITGSGRPGRGTMDAYAAARKGGAAFEHTDFNMLIGDDTPIPDAVAFGIDHPAFMATLTERQQSMALDLAAGMGTTEVARKYGVSPGAVSQFRTRFRALLGKFYGEAA
jgi:hypothetical protein